jgi:hypothetical protein
MDINNKTIIAYHNNKEILFDKFYGTNTEINLTYFLKLNNYIDIINDTNNYKLYFYREYDYNIFLNNLIKFMHNNNNITV